MILVGRLSLPHASAFAATLRLPITPDLNVFGILLILLAGLLGLLRGLIRLHWNSGLGLLCRSHFHFAGK